MKTAVFGYGLPGEIIPWSSFLNVEVCNFENLSHVNRFHKSMHREALRFASRAVVTRAPVGERIIVRLEGDKGLCFTWSRPDGLACTAITGKDYPAPAAFALISATIAAFARCFPGFSARRKSFLWNKGFIFWFIFMPNSVICGESKRTNK